MNIPSAGSVISYSAGSSDVSPWKYRVIGTQDKVSRVLEKFPELSRLIGGVPPLVVSCYPASLGVFKSAIFIDTYLKKINFLRAIVLASEINSTIIVMAQPLVALDMIIDIDKTLIQKKVKSVVVAVGGYVCPSSLESEIVRAYKLISDVVIVFHAYGAAEVDFACLVGRRFGEKVIYNEVSSDVSVSLENGQLILADNIKEANHATGDFAERVTGGVTIKNSEARASSHVIEHLESWDSNDWIRKTGYLRLINNAFIFQLRQGVPAKNHTEMDFFDFCRAYSMSFADKPNWGKSN